MKIKMNESDVVWSSVLYSVLEDVGFSVEAFNTAIEMAMERGFARKARDASEVAQ